MATLITLLIGIALTLAVGGIGVYYFGKSFDESAAKSEVARYKNEALQITGAMAMYSQKERGLPTNFVLPDLAPQYLKSIPGAEGGNSGGWVATAEKVIKTGISEKVCLIANREEGFSFKDGVNGFSGANGQAVAGYGDEFIPNCTWDGLNPDTPCCATN